MYNSFYMPQIWCVNILSRSFVSLLMRTICLSFSYLTMSLWSSVIKIAPASCRESEAFLPLPFSGWVHGWLVPALPPVCLVIEWFGPLDLTFLTEDVSNYRFNSIHRNGIIKILYFLFEFWKVAFFKESAHAI